MSCECKYQQEHGHCFFRCRGAANPEVPTAAVSPTPAPVAALPAANPVATIPVAAVSVKSTPTQVGHTSNLYAILAIFIVALVVAVLFYPTTPVGQYTLQLLAELGFNPPAYSLQPDQPVSPPLPEEWPEFGGCAVKNAADAGRVEIFTVEIGPDGMPTLWEGGLIVDGPRFDPNKEYLALCFETGKFSSWYNEHKQELFDYVGANPLADDISQGYLLFWNEAWYRAQLTNNQQPPRSAPGPNSPAPALSTATVVASTPTKVVVNVKPENSVDQYRKKVRKECAGSNNPTLCRALANQNLTEGNSWDKAIAKAVNMTSQGAELTIKSVTWDEFDNPKTLEMKKAWELSPVFQVCKTGAAEAYAVGVSGGTTTTVIINRLAGVPETDGNGNEWQYDADAITYTETYFSHNGRTMCGLASQSPYMGSHTEDSVDFDGNGYIDARIINEERVGRLYLYPFIGGITYTYPTEVPPTPVPTDWVQPVPPHLPSKPRITSTPGPVPTTPPGTKLSNLKTYMLKSQELTAFTLYGYCKKSTKAVQFHGGHYAVWVDISEAYSGCPSGRILVSTDPISARQFGGVYVTP